MVEANVPSLKVFYEQFLVGEFSYSAQQNNFSFIYYGEWLKQGLFPLSPHLPMFDEIKAGAADRFLENLLPEGAALNDLAAQLRVQKGNVYALMAAIGAESTGAFVITNKPEAIHTLFRPIGPDELTKRIAQRKDIPLMMWDGKPRLSLAGVQEKLAIVIKDGQYGLGEGGIASTHILKFSRDNVQHLVLNEYLCMSLAKKVGLSVAECDLVMFGERVLQVKRFDRKWEGQKVKRLHVIDGCQALDIFPNHKYERFLGEGPETGQILGPANFKNLSNFTDQCKTPIKARQQLIQWVLFNLMIGNCDHHIKNISYFLDQSGLSPAPAYDLVNVMMYSQFEQDLAFQIGETFKLNEVNAYHLSEMAKEVHVQPSFVAGMLNKLGAKILEMISTLQVSDLDGEELQFVKAWKSDIETRTQRFLAEVKELKKYKLS